MRRTHLYVLAAILGLIVAAFILYKVYSVVTSQRDEVESLSAMAVQMESPPRA
ncbi:hypothetical protein KQI84_13665 [bacterium]|nr:hypothetical protein [bacterium]